MACDRDPGTILVRPSRPSVTKLLPPVQNGLTGGPQHLGDLLVGVAVRGHEHDPGT
jgi:hypothetical protein